MRGTAFSIILAAAAIACGPPPRNGGDDINTPDANGGPDGNNGCAQGAESVYTVDTGANHLYRFDPPSKMFTDLGALSCPTMGGAMPFSMGVDRNTVAWVLYTSGELFQVQINNNLMCTKTSWASSLGLMTFGMGFSTDTSGGNTDTLFVSGGTLATLGMPILASVDLTSMSATKISNVPQLAEMTGNSNGELWGFLGTMSPPHVVQFNKADGTFLKDFPEPMISRQNPGYAFAHWGGDYWVFIYTMGETTTVYQVDGNDGSIKSTTPNTGRQIVGAGVSTCAPTVIF